jgi:hypothetical protein
MKATWQWRGKRGEEGGGVSKGWGEGRGEKWPKHCMHIWINEKKEWKQNFNDIKYIKGPIPTQKLSEHSII